MRLRSWGPVRAGVVAAGVGAVIASVGACTLIAGIDDGVLVNGGPGDGGPGDGGKPATDGAKGNDGGKPDATKGDAGKGHDGASAPDAKKGEGGADSGPPPKQLTCALVAGSKVMVDDLSRADAAAPTFPQGLFVTPNGGSNGFGIITGLPSDSGDQFIAYTVQLSSVSSTVYSGSLVDVVTTSESSINVLTSFSPPTGVGSSLTVFSGSKPSSLTAGSPFANITTSSYQGGKAAPFVKDGGGTGIAYATLTEGSGGFPTALGFGFAGDTNAPHDVYEQDASFGFTNNAAFFATAGSLYALMNQLQPADGGQVADTIVSAPDTLGSGGITGVLGEPPSMGALLGARTSVVTPDEVVIFGGTIGTTGDLVPCSATVPPTMVKDLTLCGPGFTLGPGQPTSSVSFGGSGGNGWNLSTDDFVIAGPNGPGTSLNIAWIAPDARVVAIAPSLIPTGTVRNTAVRFDEFIGDGTASNFDIAWIERNPADGGGSLPEKLVAAVVNCE